MGVCVVDSSGSEQESLVGSCECGDEHSGSDATDLVFHSISNTCSI
jgi:hypothetical protein